jgi:hypothetical protein
MEIKGDGTHVLMAIYRANSFRRGYVEYNGAKK